jgi:hypothetical protein
VPWVGVALSYGLRAWAWASEEWGQSEEWDQVFQSCVSAYRRGCVSASPDP